MMHRAERARRIAQVTCALWAVGCSSELSPTATDAATDTPEDRAVARDTEGDTIDLLVGDVTDAGASKDVSEDDVIDAREHADPCAAEAVVDLSALPRVGGRSVYRGTTANGPAAQPWALPSSCLPAGRAIRVVAHRYTAPADVSVAVTTSSPYSAGHDTVLWYGRNCQAPPAMTACNDDTLPPPQSRISVTGWSTGFRGYFFVATAAAQDGEPGHPYELIVDEYPTPADDAPCTAGSLAVCRAGRWCVRLGDEGYGACRVDGTTVGARCRTAEPRCDDGLECVGVTCIQRAAPGGRCRLGEVLCALGQRCVTRDPAHRRDGECVPNGTLGSACSETIACADGLQCSVAAPMGTATGLCQRHAAAGEPCSAPGLTAAAVCDAPMECVPSAPGSTEFVCRAPGAAAGARCRDDGTCDGALRCNATGGRGYCRAATDDACAPTLAASDCGAGRVCAATDATAGRCTIWAREGAADNDREAQAEAPRALPFAVRGALVPSGDADCFRFELAREGTVTVRVHDGTGRCLPGASPFVQLSGEHEIQALVRTPGCGASAGATGYHLPAGRYVACVQPSTGAAVLDYFFTMGVW